MVVWQLIPRNWDHRSKKRTEAWQRPFFFENLPAFKTSKRRGDCFCKRSNIFKSWEGCRVKVMRKISRSFLTWRWNKRKLSRWGRDVGKLVNGWWEEKDQMGTRTTCEETARPRLGMPRWSGKSRIRTTSCHGTVLLGAWDFDSLGEVWGREDLESATRLPEAKSDPVVAGARTFAGGCSFSFDIFLGIFQRFPT